MGAVWLAFAAAMLLHPRDGGAPEGFLRDAPVYMSFLQREENQTASVAPAEAAPAASNTSVDALLDLSEQVLQTTASLLPTLASGAERQEAAEPAGAGKQERKQEEKTLAALADHSGQLEKLFRQLSDGLEQQDEESEEAKEVRALTPDPALRLAGLAKTAVAEEEDKLRMQAQGDHVLHLFSEAAPEAHPYAEAAIGEDEPLAPAVATSLAQRAASLADAGDRPLSTAPGDSPEREMRHGGQVGVAGARVSVGLLVLVVFLVGAAAWLVSRRLEDQKPGAKAEDSAKPNPVPGEAEGKTSYVVRIVRVKVEPRPLRAPALAWQIRVGDQQPRPSRFAQTWVWDSGVDRIDVDVDNPAERIQVQILEQSRELLDPPTVKHEVEIPAGVLLAEARRNVEKVKSARQADQFVHEKRLSLPGGGYLVLEYSLIAFFHWYVGGDGR